SKMACSGSCPRSGDPGKVTNSRRRFWASLCNSGRPILRYVLWTWPPPSRNGSLSMLIHEASNAHWGGRKKNIAESSQWRTQDSAGGLAMSIATSQKLTASQLKRRAYLYIRQSTARQVLEHTESTTRQYALPKRAVALAWQDDQVMVMDSVQGHSDASVAHRE